MNPQPSLPAIDGQTGAPAIDTNHPSQRRPIRSDDLFSGQRAVLIEHAGALYSLRQTSKGKLILTK